MPINPSFPESRPGRNKPTASGFILPLVGVAGLAAAAIWFGGAPSALPTAQGIPVVSLLPVSGDPLPSWNAGPTKQAIINFIAAITEQGSETFVPVPERVAVFDNEGTLICEKPIVHGMFLLDRIHAMAFERPEMANEEPYATLLTGDIEAVRKLGKKYFIDLTFSTLAGVSEDQLEQDARNFLETAIHPVFGVSYAEVTFQPMHELMELLRTNRFSIWICSGSGVQFMRPAAAAWYGIEPDRVIGSRAKTELREGQQSGAGPLPHSASRQQLELILLPQMEVLNDRERKPVSIGEQIGRRPIFAAGNVGDEEDIAMLRWSQSSRRPSLQLLVQHDDALREMAYGEPLNASLKAAEQYGWHVVQMATDWNRIFAKKLEKISAAAPQTQAAVAEPASPPPVRWEAEIAAYEAIDRDHPPELGGICFIGSSNIRLWETLGDDFPGMNIINRGVGGARLVELAESAPRLLAAVEPALILVSAGGNDIADGASPQDVRRSFERFVQNVRGDLPNTKIVFLAISPSIKRWEQRVRQQAANAAVQEFVASSDAGLGIFSIDANAAFLGPDDQPAAECFVKDQLHPSTLGNSRRAAIIRPRLEELLRTGNEPIAIP